MEQLLFSTLITLISLQIPAKTAVEALGNSSGFNNGNSTIIASEPVISVQIQCKAPNPGTYSLGWGTSRLIVPEKGKPYIVFRNMTALVDDDRLCLSGDNVGLVVLKKDGSVWAYVREDN